MNQWYFYVLATKRLDDVIGKQKTITLGSLKKHNPIAVPYEELYVAIKQAANK